MVGIRASGLRNVFVCFLREELSKEFATSNCELLAQFLSIFSDSFLCGVKQAYSTGCLVGRRLSIRVMASSRVIFPARSSSRIVARGEDGVRVGVSGV